MCLRYVSRYVSLRYVCRYDIDHFRHFSLHSGTRFMHETWFTGFLKSCNPLTEDCRTRITADTQARDEKREAGTAILFIKSGRCSEGRKDGAEWQQNNFCARHGLLCRRERRRDGHQGISHCNDAIAAVNIQATPAPRPCISISRHIIIHTVCDHNLDLVLLPNHTCLCSSSILCLDRQ